MEYRYPYRFTVDSPAKAEYMIRNLCDNCSKFYCCSRAEETQCNSLKKFIASRYGIEGKEKE